jgi:hypothetical protein
MQVEHKRACPSCGADNTLEAGFCWKCYTSFAPPGPQMPAAPIAAAPASATRSGGHRVLRVVVAVVVALFVSGVVRNLLQPDYHVPESLPGMTRMHTAETDDFERRMKAEGASNDVDLEVAVYGPGAEPRVFLVLANGTAVEDTDQLFREFLGGVESSGAVVDREAQTTGSHEGAEWRCVPVRASGITASVCMWREDASVGMTLDLDPGEDLSGALLDAYDASHA